VDPDAFRNGLFALHTRRFGKVSELMIQKITGADDPLSNFHDLFHVPKGQRVEVKFSVVRAKHDAPITADNLFDAVANASRPRHVAYADWKAIEFDCNIQQIKTADFEILYYGVFFYDRVVVFRITADQIRQDPGVHYSDRQHRGNIGEGQFHLNNKTFQHHLDRYHHVDLSYPFFISLFE